MLETTHGLAILKREYIGLCSKYEHGQEDPGSPSNLLPRPADGSHTYGEMYGGRHVFRFQPSCCILEPFSTLLFEKWASLFDLKKESSPLRYHIAVELG